MQDSPPEEYQPIYFRALVDGSLEDIMLVPLASDDDEQIPLTHELYINGKREGTITYKEGEWTSTEVTDENLMAEIGEMIRKHFG